MVHDNEIRVEILAIDPKAFLTGSFLVNQDKANDIDYVIVYREGLHELLEEKGYGRGDGSYNNSNSAHTLMSVWRKDRYNLIIVKDRVAAALWKAFSNIISEPEYGFTDKKDRVKLHELITKSYKYKKE